MRCQLKVALVIVVALLCPAAAFANVSVSISPSTVQVQPGGQAQFNAVVSGTTNSVVIWSLTGVNCSGIACGQITSTGLYLAPATPPSPNVVTVTATALADLSATANAAAIVGSASDVKVSVSPATASVLVGQQEKFVAFVSGTTITGVTWSLSGASCGGSGCGTITSSGVYTAPATLPSSAQVTVTATSIADPSKSGSALVTVALPVSVSISPTAATLNTGTQRQFTASVANTTNTAVTWSVNGSGCSGANCGVVSSTGLYTAPSTVPSPAQVSVTATSVADPTKSSVATVTIIPPVAVSVTPATAQILAGGHQQFAATVTNTSNTTVNWSVAGTGCSGSGCGTITSSGLYTAPASAPTPAQVFITATSAADPTKSGTASVTIILPVTISISPSTAQVVIGTTLQLTATVANSTNTAVTWRIAGSGCTGSACGTITTSGLYTAPATVPSPATISVTATSVADSTKSATATVTIVQPVSVTVSPKTVQLLTGGKQQFSATVANTTNTAVTWTVAGSGCSGSACGTITTNGLYTAPATVPNPAQVFITATSVADPTKSSTASATISLPISVTVSPATATVPLGGHEQFTATVANTTNTGVTWSLAGSGCSGATCGTITSAGLYVAPASVPSPAQVTVKAASVADPTRSGSAVVTVALPVTVSVSPASATVAAGSQKQFSVTVSNTTNSSVTWSVTGSGCSGAACGVVSFTGLYTAPSTVPTPALVSVTAKSVADPTKSSTATVTIVPAVVVTVSPATAQVVTGAQQQFTATVKNASNTAVTWRISGSCSGAACGTITSGGLYKAPASVPNPTLIIVTATSAADPTKAATASVTIVPPIAVTVSPTTATVVAGGHQQFLASVSGTSSNSVTWSVSGGGCSGSACGVVSSGGLYTAPSTVPTPAQVTVKVVSTVDATKSATATVTLVPAVAVKIAPTTVDVTAGSTQQFKATVTGSTNTNVIWSLTGTGCSGPSCGTVSSSGLYTAPGTVPNPANVTVTATSAADNTKSASATVTIVPPVAVSVSPSAVQVVKGGQQQFTATVSGSQNTGVTWSLSGTGCSGSSCGSISSSGLYTAPGTVPTPAQVKVIATSSADGTKSGSATVTIIAPVTVTISPASATVAISGRQQFQTKVTGSTNTTVDWSLSGAGCSGTSCGTISSTGLYTAPASIPSPPTVIIKATSQIDVLQSASATVSILPNLDSKLEGQYAFEFTGFDSNGIYQAAGTFTADGNGNITAGLEDVNNTAGPANSIAFSGTYNVTGDNRGVLTLFSTLGTQTSRFALNVAGTRGRFIEFDASGIRGSGVIEQTDLSGLTLASLKGPYVLGLAGKDSLNARIGALAIFDFDGSGNILGGSLDVNDGGTVSPTFASFKGIYRIDSTGRGIANLNIPGFAGGAFRFAFYAVSPTKLLFISIDQLSPSNPLLAGPAELQSGAPFLTSTFSGPTVFSLAGEENNISLVTMGRILFDGVSQPLVTFDQNTGGVVSTDNVLTGAYSVEVNGPGTLNLDDSNGHTRTWDFYAIGPDHAFVMDASSSDVGVGEIMPQAAESHFSSADILGSYLLGTGEPLKSTATLTSGVSTFDGKSAMSGTEDVSRGGSSTAGQSLAGSYTVSSSLNNGRGTLTLISPSGETFALWVTNDAEVLALETDSSNTQPVVLYLEQ